MPCSPLFDGSPYSVRVAADRQWHDLARTVELSYGGYPEPQEVRQLNNELFEPERSLVAYFRDEVCATALVYSLRMMVPGGIRPVAGIGYVSVDPAHRRRGLMTQMMVNILHGLHESGAEPVAALQPSESAIYSRFGFGFANQVVHIELPRAPLALSLPRDEDLHSTIVDPRSCLDEIAKVYEKNVLERVGMLQYDKRWAAKAVVDPPSVREGSAPLQCLLLEGDGEPGGYALFTTRSRWKNSNPRFTVLIRELFAISPATYAQLWRALLDLDLSTTVIAQTRPIDDPLLVLLADPRSAVPTVRDQLHVRLIDVDRALSQRTYAVEVDLVVELVDPLCEWNMGRWRLQGGLEGANCTRTSSAPDLVMSVRELSSAYLGGVSLTQLGRAGRVEEIRAGTLNAACRAFRREPLPFCSLVF